MQGGLFFGLKVVEAGWVTSISFRFFRSGVALFFSLSQSAQTGPFGLLTGSIAEDRVTRRGTQLMFHPLNLLAWVMGTVDSEGLSCCLMSLQLFGFGEQPTLLSASR